MKKYLLLLLLILPTPVLAEKYYTNYKPYLENQIERIETTDLIKEEVNHLYYYKEQVKYNENYHLCSSELIDRPFKDENDKVLFERFESLKKFTNYTKAYLFATDEFMVREIRFENIDFIPKLFLYQNNLEEVKYDILGDVIKLSKEVSILDLIVYVDASNINYLTINFNDEEYYTTYHIFDNNPYIELSFSSHLGMKSRLEKLGVYTSSIFSIFSYYVNYSYKCLFYNLKEEIKTTTVKPNNYYKKDTTYNYLKRDFIEVSDYLILEKNKEDVNKIIQTTSLDINDIKISKSPDVKISGVYELSIKYADLDIKRPLIIVNNANSNFTCPPVKTEYIEVPKEVIKYVKERETCEPIIKIEEKTIPVEKIKYVPKKVVEIKEVPKYITKEKIVKEKCIEQPKTIKNAEKIKAAYFIPIIPLSIFLVSFIVKKKKAI